MKVSGRPSHYESSGSNASIATHVDEHGVEMRVEPSREEYEIGDVSVWLTASGKLSRGMQRGLHYTIDVELTPEEVVRAFIALPPQTIPEAIANVLLNCNRKTVEIEEFRAISDRHHEALVNKADITSTLHAMLDAFALLADAKDSDDN